MARTLIGRGNSSPATMWQVFSADTSPRCRYVCFPFLWRRPRICALVLISFFILPRFAFALQEPVIPHDRYHDFRNVLTRQPPLSTQEAIDTYKHLIQSLPRANQYLLLYVLDLLSVFAKKSDKNLMTAQSTFSSYRTSLHLEVVKTRR